MIVIIENLNMKYFKCKIDIKGLLKRNYVMKFKENKNLIKALKILMRPKNKMKILDICSQKNKDKIMSFKTN